MQEFSDTLPQAMLDLAEHPGFDGDYFDLTPPSHVGGLERAAHACAIGRGGASTASGPGLGDPPL